MARPADAVVNTPLNFRMLRGSFLSEFRIRLSKYCLLPLDGFGGQVTRKVGHDNFGSSAYSLRMPRSLNFLSSGEARTNQMLLT